MGQNPDISLPSFGEVFPEAALKNAKSFIFSNPNDEPAILTAVDQSGKAYVVRLFLLPVAPPLIPLCKVEPEQPAVDAMLVVDNRPYGK